MSDALSKVLGSVEGPVFVIVLVVIGLNVLLTSLKKSLGWLKDKTETKADDRAHAIVVKVLLVLDRLLEFASANSAALPARAKAELAKGEWKVDPATDFDPDALAESVAEKLKSEGKP